MYTLLQSLKIRGSAGEPLPIPFESLTAAGTEFYRSQLVLIAAGPGTGKSAFTLTLALKSEVPCMYFSADSDPFVQLSRAVAITKGCTLEKAAGMVRNGDLGDDLRRLLTETPIRFSYEASPTIDDIEDELAAYEEVYGDFPSLIVVDNITNVVGKTSSGDDDPFSGLESLMDYLSKMARDTEACVIGLHHVTGEYNDAHKPIPLSGVKGQITRVPAMVLTLHRRPSDTSMDFIGVSTVKNRGGKADPSGGEFVPLEFDGNMMRIRDPYVPNH